ncbi:MAG: D-alanyl-D-alanine carboxypeptidase family protein [Candidatus Berkelbacteria bacterium]|nr:MAG: D-alanyl-D-alanine carboxypeptidase family protein [Candidatus Berkelbacteria bacterium]QQG51806.1 MAG: D-alanyl-D-alanine carboxypeptidase family protein [Candidatus Berkelbacteria bacterium]
MKPFPVPIVIGGVREPMAALDKVKIIENHEPLVDLRIACPLVIFPSDAGTPDGMQPYLRKTAATMLDQASRRLPEGLQLFALSAWRSFERQKSLWQQHYDLHKKIHPDWPEASLRRAANQYAAPCDHYAPPGHCTGAAIDVVLQTTDGQFVDILPDCGKDTAGIHQQQRIFENLSLSDVTKWKLGATWATHLSPEMREYRTILIKAMYGVGFSNCRDEYWHFSYGDSGWAVRVGKKECPYGRAEVPKSK